VLEDYTKRLEEADRTTAQLTAASLEALEGLPIGSLSFDFKVATTTTPTTTNPTSTGGTAHEQDQEQVGEQEQEQEKRGGSVLASSVVIFNPSMHTRTEVVRVEFAQIGAPFAYVIPSVYRIQGEPDHKNDHPKGHEKPMGKGGNSDQNGRPSASARASSTTATGQAVLGKGGAVAAQVEANDRYTSQLTASHHALPNLTNAVFFFATIPPLGTAKFTIEYDATGKNSTTTVAPLLTVGVKEVAKRGLGYHTDPQCPVRVFRQKFTPEDAIGSHGRSLETNMRVTNGIPLGSSLLLPVGTVHCVQTLKVTALSSARTMDC
jgi:hypothetical protein